MCCLQADVLVCAKSGGLLRERMRLVADLWAAGIRAEMMMTAAPSLTDQYEHANGRHIPWLVIMEASKLSASDTVKVSRAGRHILLLEGSSHVATQLRQHMGRPCSDRPAVWLSQPPTHCR